MGVALEAVRIEADLNVICPIATQSVDLHIHCDIGVGILSKRNLVAVVAESVGDLVDTVNECAHAGAVGCGVAGVGCATGHCRLAQIVSYGLAAGQLDAGDGNRVSVINAIGNLGVPLRTAEDADTDAGELAVNQIVFSVQLDSLLFASLENNLVGIGFVGVALEAVRIEADLNIVCPIATQGVDLHIHCDIGVGILNKRDLVSKILEAVRKNDRIADRYLVGAEYIAGKAGAVGAAGDSRLVQVKGLRLLAFQIYIGDSNRMSVVNAIRDLGVPQGTPEDADTDAGELAVHQILCCIQLNSLLLAHFEHNTVGIRIVSVALEVVGIETDLDFIFPNAGYGIQLHIQAEGGIEFLGLSNLRFGDLRFGDLRLSNLRLGDLGLGFLRNCLIHKGDHVTVVQVAAGDRNDAVSHSCDAAAVGVGKAGLYRGSAQVIGQFILAFQTNIGNC